MSFAEMKSKYLDLIHQLPYIEVVQSCTKEKTLSANMSIVCIGRLVKLRKSKLEFKYCLKL